jgi:hypothetical protein
MRHEKRGRVWIAPATFDPIPKGMWVDPVTTTFAASWQYVRDEAPEDAGVELLGQEEIVGADAAIAWGRERAQIVLIRLSHSAGSYFSAGEVTHSGSLDAGSIPAWPPTGPPPQGWFTPAADSDDE